MEQLPSSILLYKFQWHWPPYRLIVAFMSPVHFHPIQKSGAQFFVILFHILSQWGTCLKGHSGYLFVSASSHYWDFVSYIPPDCTGLPFQPQPPPPSRLLVESLVDVCFHNPVKIAFGFLEPSSLVS